MIFLSASVWQILALGVDGFHTNQCIIMQQEFAREFGEISPSICSFGVDEPIKFIFALEYFIGIGLCRNELHLFNFGLLLIFVGFSVKLV